ncbi:MAG: HAD family acid phosphatase [Stellaceae bacterium]
MTSRSKGFITVTRTAIAVSLLAGFLAACAAAPGDADIVGRYCTTSTPFPIPSQPINVDDLPKHVSPAIRDKAIAAARKYYRSHQYMIELARIDAAAQAYVIKRAQDNAAKNPPDKLALVLDIDETSLSNWPEIDANNFDYFQDGPCPIDANGKIVGHTCGAVAWDKTEKATAIKPTLDLFNTAKKYGVTVFFITGRDKSEKEWTEENLRKAGYADWQELMMRPPNPPKDELVDTYKTLQRAKLMARGYTIVASVGDQPSDLQGGCAESAYLLPDPFYRIP